MVAGATIMLDVKACGRMKSELLYDRYNTESLTTDELRVLILEIFHQLLEQQEDLLCQRWASSYD